jgi:5,10-methylenetetrahydrofolate reductase
MTHGPCGGVRLDGGCELGDRRCTFVAGPVVGWDRPAPTATDGPAVAALRERLAAGRVVVADFPAAALSGSSVTAVADRLRGRVDAVLAGDSPRNRVQFPPAYRAKLISDAGLTPWPGLNCRDRNRVALEGELAALVHAGVGAVHCVTGDHPQIGSRPDARPVFDLDSTELAALARSVGLLVSVAESPASPPVDRRAARLREKLRAGAEVCFVNHAGGVEPVRIFVEQVAALGPAPYVVACVPVVVDPASAALLASFPSLALPPGYLERILGAADPHREGVTAAVELAEALLALDGVHGVNLSGGGAPGDELGFATALADISVALTTGVRA